MAKILGVRVDNLSFKEAVAKIASFLNGNQLRQIVTVNPEFVMFAQKDENFRKIINQSDLAMTDGFGLKLAAWFLDEKIGERITGVDLTWELAKMAQEKGYAIFLLGANVGVAQKAAKRFKIIYPNLKIAGIYAGSPEEQGIIERINQSGADILLVAFGAPKQDKFIYKNRKLLKVKVAMGVGGTFDYIAGKIPRAPGWMRTFGLEWLYRLFRQPGRWNRILTATIRFPLAVLKEKFNLLP